MSLDVSLVAPRRVSIYDANITHNLNSMAKEAGIYMYLWRPDELGITKASELIEPLSRGLKELMENPAKFKAMTPPNGWGTYEALVEFVNNYLMACTENTDADVEVSR